MLFIIMSPTVINIIDGDIELRKLSKSYNGFALKGLPLGIIRASC